MMCVRSVIRGLYLLVDSLGSPDRSKSVGIDGPKMSVSRIPALKPSLANESDRFAATILSQADPRDRLLMTNLRRCSFQRRLWPTRRL